MPCRRLHPARIAAFVVTLTVLGLLPSASSALTAGQATVPGEIILKFKPGAAAAKRSAVLSELGAEVKSELTFTGALLLRLPDDKVATAVARYAADADIAYIEPNFIWQADVVPNDPSFGELWGLSNDGRDGGTVDADIDAPEAWDQGTGSADVVVAIIDTGIDPLHPDLAANMWTNPGEIAGNGLDDDTNGYIDDVFGYDFVGNDPQPVDDHGHGTHCAGTIGAVGNNGVGIAGVNWRVKLMAVKFLDAGGYGTTDAAVASVGYAVRMGADILSNSWGGGAWSQALLDAISQAGEAGVLFVAAAGNSSYDNDAYPHYPSSYALDNIIAVAATDNDDQLAYFSCWGATSVDIAAPGVSIYSTLPDGGYGYMDGTSMACPHVSGALALILARFPGIPAASARLLVFNSADPLPQLSGLMATGARLNVFRAMAGVDTIPPAPIVDLAVAATAGQWIELAWTATGDDGSIGTPTAHEIRFATFPLDALNFDTGTRVTGLPRPLPAGAPEMVRVTGLAFDTTYWFAVSARDEYGLFAPVTASVTATTGGPPVMSVEPGSVSASLLPGARAISTVTIANSGPTELAWTAAVRAASGLSAWEWPAVPAPASLPTVDRDLDVAQLSSSPVATPALSTQLLDLDGVRILWDTAHGQYPVDYYWVQLAGELRARGAEVFDSEAAWTPQLLADVDIVWLTDIWIATSPAEQSTLAGWLAAGGNLLIESDNSGPDLNPVLTAVGAGISYGGYGSSGVIRDIVPHPATADVSAIRLFYPETGFALVVPPAGVLARDAQQEPVLAWSRVGRGRIVALTDEMFADGLLGANDNHLLGHRVIDWLATGTWLTLDPAAGVVPPGATAGLDVIFDAERFCNLDASGLVAIEGNDPLHPGTTVAATLDVGGGTDIAVSPTPLIFGSRYLTTVAVDSVLVSNGGCDRLEVSGAAIDDPEFTLGDGGPFSLEPGSSRYLVVTWGTETVGAVAATLNISSNDPDEPVLAVSIVGTGAEPPIISVLPDSLSAAAPAGEPVTRTLTITNSGLGALEWRADARAPHTPLTMTLAPRAAGALPLPNRREPPTPAGATDADAADSNPRTAELEDLTGTRILWTLAHENYSTEYWAVLVGDLRERGAEVVETEAPLTAALLEEFDVVWANYGNATWTDREVADLVAWVRAGGGLLLETFEPEAFTPIVTALSAGLAMMPGYVSDGTSLVVPHPVTAGLGRVQSYYSYCQVVISGVPAQPLALSSLSFEASAAATTTGRGRVVLLNAPMLDDGLIGYDDNRVFGNQAIDWLRGLGWLTVAPASGTVPPLASQELAVTFDAGDLCGSAYAADVEFRSNDPHRPAVDVPTSFDVLGTVHIEVAPDSLAFGPCFIGGRLSADVAVIAAGCEDLEVAGVFAGDGPFSVSPAGPFTVAPFDTVYVRVEFAADVVGELAGVLGIRSNDADRPLVEIPLSGRGLEPPVITVAPTALAESLVPGDRVTRLVTIGNEGASDLVWSASVQPSDSLALALDLTTADAGFAVTTTAVEPGSADEAVAPFLRQAWTNRRLPIDVPKILLLATRDGADDAYAMALRMAGLSHVIVTNWSTLGNELAMASDWDLVIVHSTITASTSVLNQLLAHVDRGGALIHADTRFGGYASHALLTRLGVGFSSTHTTPLDWVARDPGHRLFWWPHRITQLRTTVDAVTPNGVDGVPLDGAQVLADFSPVGASAAIILGPTGRTLCNLFHLADYGADDDSDNVRDAIEVAANEIALLARGEPWVQMVPVSGVLAPGQTFELPVAFDAATHCGGRLEAPLVVTSNDPLLPTVTVPLSLEVAGTPDVAATGAASFTQVFLGASAVDTLVVENAGCATLTVHSITTTAGDFTVEPAGPFTIEARSWREILVTFAPTTPGVATTQIVVASDDPDEPYVSLAAEGLGLVPPVIEVSGESLSVDLAPWRVATRQLTVSNRGGNTLAWSVEADVADSLSALSGFAELSVPARRIIHMAGWEPDTDPWALALTRLGLPHIKVQTWGELEAYLATSTPWDLVVVTGAGTPPVSGLNRLSQHLDGGGRLIVSAMNMGGLLHGLWSQLGVTQVASLPVPRPFVAAMVDHPCFWWPEQVPRTFAVNSSYGQQLQIVAAGPGSQPLARYLSPDGGEAIVLGHTGRTIFNSFLPAAYSADADGDGTRDVVELAMNELAYLAMAAPWVSVQPRSGIVLAGATQELTVTFNTSDRCGQRYEAPLVFSSNDPHTPQVSVPASLDVSRGSHLVCDPSQIAFGSAYLGSVVARTIGLRNTGCEPLTVYSVTTDLAEVTIAGAGPYTLAPDSLLTLSVTWIPEAGGPMDGVVTITSDDPDQPTLGVGLTGLCLVAPTITVSPDSLDMDLMPGARRTRRLEVANHGPGPLNWSASVVFDQVTSAWDEAADYRVVELPPSPGASTADQASDKDAAGPQGARRYTNVNRTGSGPRTIALVTYLPDTDAYNLGLQRLGLDFTLVYNWWDFRWYLQQSDWDLVVVSNRGYSPVEAAQDLLVAHVDAGGTLIYNDGSYYGSNLPELFTRMGVNTMTSSHGDFDVVAHDPDHRLFRQPDRITEVKNTLGGGVYVDVVTLRVGAVSLAGFTGAAGPNAIVLGPGGRTLFNAFQPGDFAGDDDLDGRSDMVELAGNEIVLMGLSAFWVRLDPSSGVVPAGASQEVVASFDANFICDRDARALITITHDDPHRLPVELPVAMRVPGGNDITVAPSRLDFGSRFLGTVRTDTLIVGNRGCIPLHISAIESDRADFTVALPGPVTVGPDSTLTVLVTCAPLAPGQLAGQVTLTSDDPDEPVVVVETTCFGVAPAAIVVAPDSVSMVLPAGSSASRVVTISNNGSGALDWSLQQPTTGTGGDLTGLRILWPRGHGEFAAVNWSTFTGELTARGAVVVESDQPVDSTLLAGFDIVYVNHATTPWETAEAGALVRWLWSGGSLLCETSTTADFTAILAAAETGIAYVASASAGGFTSLLDPHVITQGVANLSTTSSTTVLSSITGPAARLARGPQGQSIAALSSVGAGRVVALSHVLFNNSRLGTASNRVFGHHVIDWLSGGAWLSFSPAAGSIAAGASQELTLTFASGDNCGATRHRELRLDSNDPLLPRVVLPVTMLADGAPAITIDRAAVDFGACPVGVATLDSLRISNEGCGRLEIVGITVAPAAFTVSAPGPLSLAPKESVVLRVTCAPDAPGELTGTLSLASDDPAAPEVVVPLSAIGVAEEPVPMVTLTALVGGLTSGAITLGTDPRASDGLDPALDLPAAPPQPAPSVEAWFARPEWTGGGDGRYRSDWRAAYDTGQNTKSWRFEVATDVAGQATLSAEANAAVAAPCALLLIDRMSGRTHDLLADPVYTWDAAASEVRSFTVRLGAGIPAASPDRREMAAGWSLVAAPLVPAPGATLGDVFLAAAAPSTPWLFGWQASSRSYEVLATSTSHVPGTGCWLNSAVSYVWSLEGAPATDGVSVELTAGWSLVGYPLWFPGSVQGLTVTHEGVRYGFADATRRGLVSSRIYGADAAGSYVLTGDLTPWHAFWVASHVDGLSLGFRHDWMEDGERLPPSRWPPAKARSAGKSADTATGPWSLAVAVVADQPVPAIVLGQDPDATDGFDAALDLPAPPPAPVAVAAPALTLPRPEWSPATGDDWLSDLRAPGQRLLTWAARLTVPAAGPVTLTWDGLDLPAGVDLELRSHGQVLVPSLKSQAQVELAVPAAGLDLDFAVVDGTQPPPAGWLDPRLRNEPNPFNPQTRILFELPAAGDAVVMIHDLRGVLVRELRAGRLPAGPAALVWDGLDNRGQQAASGNYVCRLRLDGRSLGASRKMVLLK
jgi:subtilisin family serine protease